MIPNAIYGSLLEQRAVWFYSGDFKKPQPYMIDNLLEKRINTIYFSSVNDEKGWENPEKVEQYEAFIRYAKEMGVKVFAVTFEDPSYVLKNEYELRAEFEGFILQTNHLFDTYIIDVEPHAINIKYDDNYPSFVGNQKMYFEKYIQMSSILRVIADTHNVKYIDTIPSSWHMQMKSVGIENGIGSLSSHGINLMTYESNIENCISTINDIQNEINNTLIMNIKVTPGFDEPYISYENIPHSINALKNKSLSFAFWYASEILLLPSALFMT